jgi:hypothetical protein
MKISPWTIIVVGLSISLIMISYALFQFFLPNSNQAALFRTWGQELKAEADKLPRAKKRVDNAIEQVKEAEAKWDVVVRTKTPPSSVESGGINLAVDRYTLTVHSLRFRDSVQSAINRQMRSGGVTVISGAAVPPPTDDPATILSSYYLYPDSTAMPVAVFDLGQVTVRGTWDQIRANIENWSNMPNYLAVADNVTIVESADRQLTATYDLTVVAFVRGKEISPAIPGAGAVAAAPGGFGAPGAPGPGQAGMSRGRGGSFAPGRGGPR